MSKLLSSSCLLLALAAPVSAQTDWSTFFGRAGDEFQVSMTTDGLGRIYVCGKTDSVTHVTAGAYQPAIAGGDDAFVACLDPRLPPSQQLLWSTHIGGTGDDMAVDVDVDFTGTRVTVVGYTFSADFPIRAGWQSQHGGGRDGFVAVFEPRKIAGAQLIWSSFLGGSGDDTATGVAHRNGVIAMVGVTDSANFPLSNAYQSTNAGGRDLFVTQMTSDGKPVFSTYLGGRFDDGLRSFTAGPFGEPMAHIVADDSGRWTIASATLSSDYPNPNGRLQGPRGDWDIAVSQLDFGGTLIDSVVLGGTMKDAVHGLRSDSGHVILAGSSNSVDFPVTANRLQDYAGKWDGILVHLDVGQNQLSYATYLGGFGADHPTEAYREASGTFVVGGHSYSPNFPTTAGAPSMSLGTLRSQLFLARLRPGAASTSLHYSTWFGGSASQGIRGMEPDGQGGVVIAGPTISQDFPVTANAFDTSLSGVRDGWITVHRMLPAAVTRYGVASSPCGPRTYLQMSNAPVAPNTTLSIETHNAPAGAVGALFLGLPNPAGVEILGAQLFVGGPMVMAPTITAGVHGFASQAFPLPVGLKWDGSFAVQSLWLNSNACAPGTLTTSNAMR